MAVVSKRSLDLCQDPTLNKSTAGAEFHHPIRRGHTALA